MLPDCRGPFYMLGHSTGSLVALLAAPSMVNRVRRMVLIAPLLSLDRLAVFDARRSAALPARSTAVGLGSMYMAGGPRPRETKPFSTNVLTTDHTRYRRNSLLYETYPQLALGGPTVAWVRAACTAAETVQDPDFIARMQIPMLFVAAGADAVVSTPAIEHYVRQMQVGIAADHRRRAPRDLAGGRHLSRAVARRLRRLHSGQRSRAGVVAGLTQSRRRLTT